PRRRGARLLRRERDDGGGSRAEWSRLRVDRRERGGRARDGEAARALGRRGRGPRAATPRGGRRTHERRAARVLEPSQLLELLHRGREAFDRGLLRTGGAFDLLGDGQHLLGHARLVALTRVELVDHLRDVLVGLGDLTRAARLRLARALHMLRDGAHLLGASHDELRAARLLRRGRRDLLHRLGDAPNRIGDLLRALRLLDRRPGDGAHHVRALLRAVENLLERALGL